MPKSPNNSLETAMPNENTHQVKRLPRELICLSAILLIMVAMVAGHFLLAMTQAPVTTGKPLHILDRSEWKGEPPRQNYKLLNLPVSSVIIHHTASEGCESEEVCIYRMRVIQDFHMKSLNWTDIAYNFLVGGDGQIYVGRGWHIQGQHVKGYGAVTISIAFIGTFINVEPAQRQVDAAQKLMEEGVRLHKLHPDYHIYAHRQLSATQSPGDKLFELMKHWPRWSPNVDELRRLNNETLKFVPRAYWLAQAPTQSLKSLILPIDKVQFVSTQTESCITQAECTFRMRSLQTQHIESLQLADINYNFVLGGDGNVYVGRGWDKSCDGKESQEFVVGFMGKSQPSASQEELMRELLKQGKHLGHLRKDYELRDDKYNLRIIPRGAWLAQPAKNQVPELKLPVSLILVLATNSESCRTQAECVFRVRFCQTFNIESEQKDDIAYNFLIGDDGYVYVGRGWQQEGDHFLGYNNRSLSVAYIGSYQNQKPTLKQQRVIQLLLNEGVRLGYIATDYRLTTPNILTNAQSDMLDKMVKELSLNVPKF